MEQINGTKIKVVIGAKQLLFRLGIKTIIGAIGVESELYQCKNFDEVKGCLLSIIDLEYLVINEDVMPLPIASHLNKIKDLKPNCKILFIGDTLMEKYPYCNYALNVESQKEMVERFQNFFFEPEPPKKNSDLPLLSDREIDVLKEVAHGMANKEIADKLNISANTVITHRKNITDKLGIKTISGLTVYAILNKLINPEDVKS